MIKTPLMIKIEAKAKQQLERFLETQLKHKSMTLLAKQLGIGVQTLSEWVDKFGITKPKKPILPISLKKPSIEKLNDLYLNQGLSQQKIADIFGVSQTLVSQWMLGYGIKTKFRGIKSNLRNTNPNKAPVREKLYDLYHNKKLSQREIAKKYGVKQISVFRWMKAYDIPSRSLTQAQTLAQKGQIVSKLAKSTLHQLYIIEERNSFDIAKEFGVNHSTITDWLHNYKIPVREPLMGRKHYLVCKDGHRVRSSKERAVCNWLYKNNIHHLYEPSSKLIKAKFKIPRKLYSKAILPDFLTGNTLIEVWAQNKEKSLTDISGVYNHRMEEKQELYKKLADYGVKFIEVYSDDKIDEILKLLLTENSLKTESKKRKSPKESRKIRKVLDNPKKYELWYKNKGRIRCQNCGVTVKRKPKDSFRIYYNRKYCGKKCADLARTGVPFSELIGKEREEKRKKLLSEIAKKNKKLIKFLPGQMPHNYKGGQVKLKCNQCGKEYSVYPYRVKMSNYCSRSCVASSKLVPSGKRFKKGQIPWNKGKKTGRVPWNKGIKLKRK